MKKKTYPKMAKKWKIIWLRALRGESPEGVYHQTQGQLSSFDDGHYTFCCLGVLQNEVRGFNDSRCSPTNTEFAFPTNPLPDDAVFEETKLNSDAADTLAGYNDQKKWGFKKIANWIEKNL